MGFKGLLAVAALLAAPLADAADITNGPWSWEEPGFTGAALQSIAVSSGGKLLAVGLNGAVFSSSDGTHWTARRTGLNEFTGIEDIPDQGGSFDQVTWWDGRFVAVGIRMMGYSTDGVTWKGASGDTSFDNFVSLTGNSHTLVALTSSGEIYTTSDGASWKEAQIVGSFFPKNIALLGETFYVAYDTLQHSSDGRHWATVSGFPGTTVGTAVSNGAGTLMLVSDGTGDVWSTADAVTWTPVAALPSGFFQPLHWDGIEFTLISLDATHLTWYSSTDGTSWTAHTQPQLLNSITWTGSEYLATGGNPGMLSSPDGSTWTPLMASSSADYRSAAWDATNHQFLLWDDTNMYAGQGSSWTTTPKTGASVQGDSVVKGSDVFLGTDIFGVLATSSDGIAWTATGINNGNEYSMLAECGHKAVAFATFPSNGWEEYSDGLSTWHEKHTSLPGTATQLACGNGEFVVALGTNMAVSADGQQWKVLPWPATIDRFDNLIQLLSFVNGRFVAIFDSFNGNTGADNFQVFSSTDGVTWTQTNPATDLPDDVASPSMRQLVWDGKEYVGTDLGLDADLWVSDDLKTWYQETPVPGFFPATIAAGGGHLLAAGSDDIIESVPGALKAPVMHSQTVPVDFEVAKGVGNCDGTDANGFALVYATIGDFSTDSNATLDSATGAFSVNIGFSASGPDPVLICRASNGVVITGSVVTFVPAAPPPPPSGGNVTIGKGSGGSFSLLCIALLSLFGFGRRHLARH